MIISKWNLGQFLILFCSPALTNVCATNMRYSCSKKCEKFVSGLGSHHGALEGEDASVRGTPQLRLGLWCV